MGKDCKTIVWFRRDLRIEDNPALAAASRDGSVLPVFIWCPEEEGQFQPGRVSRWWLKQSLLHLQKSLKNLGAELVLIRAKTTLSALLDCVNAVGANRLVYNHLYDPISLVRDHNVKLKLAEIGIEVQSYNSDLLFEPWEVKNDNGQAFTTFDAYWEKCLSMQTEVIVFHSPPWCIVNAAAGKGSFENSTVGSLGLENESEKSSNALLGRAWAPNWSNADKAFNEFVEHDLVNYSVDRLRVGGNSTTSLLSPYLHFGELSIRKVFQTARMKQVHFKNEENSVGEESATLFIKALGLREYSRYVCFNHPFAHERLLLPKLKYFPWDTDEANFKAWRQGRTGYPLVDAGMRELWATGWIHNRIRVIVSSFLVKFLLLPWQWGMKYFWDTLIDADLESDILGWHYISGSLSDGHELDRMDSPQIQGFNFDSEGDYVRQWLPELARMPNEWIHHPWDAPASVLRSAGIELGLNYPNPIIDIDLARVRLTESISVMQTSEANEMELNSSSTDEVVFDNSESIMNLSPPPPAPAVNDKNPNPASSSYDQQVPSMRGMAINNAVNRKRPCLVVDEHDRVKGKQAIVVDDDLVSTTGESCATKKQMSVSSGNSFSVPQTSSSISIATPFPFPSQLDYRLQDEADKEDAGDTSSSPESRNKQVTQRKEKDLK